MRKALFLPKKYVKDFLRTIDCYLMGSQTYIHALELGWPYGDVPVIVLTRRERNTDRENVEFYNGDLDSLVNERIKLKYQNIWMVGGAQLTKEFMRLKLADDIRISIMPVILGGGTLFFDYIGQEQVLHLKDLTAYKDGMVELWYEIKHK